MLNLKKISKSYKTGSFIQKALNEVSIDFRKNEFVAILGASGSGKTTLLNIIGGLDRYDSGDLIINGKSTKKFKNKNWDSYRNNCIGFIFQNYNLITHINILDNIELSMTLSGVSKRVRRKKALNALKRVGLLEHAHKRPNQLSGGQMQRVAIARALVNDPDIILADEPTGALDSKTSIQIMDLIKEIAKDKLVIMVTHNPELASQYASRIIKFKDGNLISDSNPIDKKEENCDFKIKKTSMSFIQALKLSFNNIMTKKGRTLITAFASSIGIIGIALILSLSNGFNIQIDKFEKDTLSSLPIAIMETGMNFDPSNMKSIQDNMNGNNLESYSSKEEIIYFNPEKEMNMKENNLSPEYLDYINDINNDDISGITYGRTTLVNTIIKNKDTYKLANLSTGFIALPKNDGENSFINQFFDVIKGTLPKNKTELAIVVDAKNRLSSVVLESLGYKEEDKINFDDILNKEIKLVYNKDLYKEINNNFIINHNFKDLYNSDNTITLKITAILRGKESKKTIVGNSMGIYYTEDLVDDIIENNKNSAIVKKQREIDYNILTGNKFENDKEKNMILSSLGDNTAPSYIYIFPKDFASKNKITEYLDRYNDKVEEKDKVLYIDQSKLITSLSSSIMDAITVVLIAFSAISLVVSSIMIGIITYISVLERTKEIGILRSLGARSKDISRVFTAETFLIGLTSGILGIIITEILCIPANIIIENLTTLKNVAILNPIHAIILLIISIILTLIGGFIPARIASKKDPVEALRTE